MQIFFRLSVAVVLGVAAFEKSTELFRDWYYFGLSDISRVCSSLALLVLESSLAFWLVVAKSDWWANLAIALLFSLYSIASGLLLLQGNLVCPCFPVSNFPTWTVFAADLAILCIATGFLFRATQPSERTRFSPVFLSVILLAGVALAASGPIVDHVRCEYANSSEVIASIGRVVDRDDVPEPWRVVSLTLANRSNSAVDVSGFHPSCGVKPMSNTLHLEANSRLPCIFDFKLVGVGKEGFFSMVLTCKIGNDRVSQIRVPVRIQQS